MTVLYVMTSEETFRVSRICCSNCRATTWHKAYCKGKLVGDQRRRFGTETRSLLSLQWVWDEVKRVAVLYNLWIGSKVSSLIPIFLVTVKWPVLEVVYPLFWTSCNHDKAPRDKTNQVNTQAPIASASDRHSEQHCSWPHLASQIVGS